MESGWMGMIASIGGGLGLVQAVALRCGWVGMQVPSIRARGVPWGVALVVGGVLWRVVGVADPGHLVWRMPVGAAAGLGMVLLAGWVRPLEPDAPFLPGAGARAVPPGWPGFRAGGLELSGHPDAGALLLRPELEDGSPGPDGAARPLAILLHGGGNDRLCGLWYLVERLLARGHLVLTAHLPGHGRGGEDRFTTERARSRVDALVQAARAHTVGPVVLIGQSMGGALALDYAARDGRVEAVVSVSAPASLRVPFRLLLELGNLPRALTAMRYGTPGRLLPAYRSFRREVYPVRLEAGAPDYVEVFARAVEGMALEARLEQRRGAMPPLLIVHGSRDGVVPVAQAEALREAAGGAAALRVMPGLHHLDVLLDPAAVEGIVGWIEEERGAGVTSGPISLA